VRDHFPDREATQHDADAPSLSIIVAARNDDHGGSFLRRMQIFMDGLLQQAIRHRLNSELIIVEWNPPADRPRLADALRWGAGNSPCRVRIIEVPREVHQRYPFSDKLPLFQMIAKNVGIRRARGVFVLCTNVDLLFSDDLMRFLADGRLQKHCMYRIDRMDVPADVPTEVSLDDQLQFCRRNVIRVNTRWGTYAVTELRFLAMLRRLYQKMRSAVRATVRRISAAVKRLPRVLRRIRAAVKRRIADRRWSDLPRVLMGVLMGALMGAIRVARNTLGVLGGVLALLRKPLHTNACGDFTVLSRAQWVRLRGYPEWPMYSFHLDSVLCQMAYRAGLREVVLHRDMRLYHIDHHSGWSPESADILIQRMNLLGVPVLDFQQYWSYVLLLRTGRLPLICNSDGWGLASETLPEITPTSSPSPVSSHSA
jgi:hypothetical protein